MAAVNDPREPGWRFGLAAAAERDAAARNRLGRQVRRARLWLPAAIIAIVLLFELGVLPSLGPTLAPWVRVAFYAILGPLATSSTLTWVLQEVQGRERAQGELSNTYLELQESHDLLAIINRITERFAAASDVEDAVRAGASGLIEATQAKASAVVLGASDRELAGELNLDDDMRDIIRSRDARIRGGGTPALRAKTSSGDDLWILSAPIRLAGTIEGSVHVVFDEEPAPRAFEAFLILSSDFAAVVEASRSRMRDLLTLYDVDRSIRAEGNLDRLLDMLLERTMARVHATRGAIFLGDGGPLLHPKKVRPDQVLEPLRVGEDALAKLAEAGRPHLLGLIGRDIRREAGGLLENAACCVVIPLEAEQEMLGALVLAHDAPGAMHESQLPFLSLLASQVSLAVKNARAYLQSEEVAIAEERARIAREIHDGVAQSLAFAALKIDLGRKLLEKDAERASNELEQAGSTVRESIREVRRSIFALRPVDLERHGFAETVRRYVDDFGPQNGVQVQLEIEDLGTLDARSEATLFRIFQEAMHNVAKHSAARTVWVRLGRQDDQTFVDVRDDGKGFDLDSVHDRVSSAGGLGLRQMRERIEARGGSFTLTSAPGEGTNIRASLG